MNRSGRGLFIPDSEELIPNQNQSQAENTDPSLSRTGLNRDDEDSGFLDILNFTTEYNIPSFDLDRLGVSGDPRIHDRIAYTLGTGHTSVVIRHITEDDTEHIIPKGSIIALKKFLPNTNPKENPTSSLKATYKTVKKELGVFCHGLLSEHPNICKLLFLGWEKNLPLPILGMELGAYGSLEWVLTAPGLGLSFLQKANLTIDIALGLSALHYCGIVHGDLKPENILVLEHAERQIVGKLTDFGGAARIQSGESPGHITELWCPPEVLFHDRDIDWAKADVYSYGLIVASIWARSTEYLTEASENSSFLSEYLPSVFTERERRDLLLVLKSDGDENVANILVRALAQLDEGSRPLLDRLLRETLSSIPGNRKGIVDLVLEEIAFIASELDRDISADFSDVDVPQSRFIPSGKRLFKVWSPSFRERSFEFQNFVLKQMLAEVGDADDILDISFEDLPDTPSADLNLDEYLSLMVDKTRAFVKASTDDNVGNFNVAWHRARLAFHISMCYLFPVGTSFDLLTGLKWLFVAAYGGYQYAVFFAPLLRRCWEGDLGFKAPMKLFLSLGVLVGSRRALDVLREEDFLQHQIIIRILQERSSACGQVAMESSSPYFMDALLSYQKTESLNPDHMDLLTALKSHNVSQAVALLEEGGDTSVLNAKGVGVMHYLSVLRDESGADLAVRCFQNGARLDIESTDEDVTHMRVVSGTPLKWAALKGRTKLFSKLVELHKLHDVPILDYDAVLATLTIGHHTKTMKAFFEFKIEKPELCPSHDPEILSPNNLLLVAMDSRDTDSLERRLYHGPASQKAYKETVLFLLEQGADPTKGVSTSCPFYRALQQDDDTPLQLFVKYLPKYQPDPLRYLEDPGQYSQFPEANMHNALQICIYAKSVRCFNILLDNFPEMMEMKNAGGLTALHSASYYKENLPMLKILLEKGANILVWSKDGSTPLFRALRNINLEAADLIREKCTPEEMEKLLGHDETTGFSTMSKLMGPWISRRNPAMLQSFQWIADHGGAHFIGERKHDERLIENPIWNPVLCRANPLTPSQAALDAKLLEMLLDMFPDRLEYIQYDGRAPLHLAVWYCNPEVVRMLLDRGVDVNLEFGRSRIHPDEVEAQRMMGKTALNHAILRMKAIALPDVVKRGGAVEINRFRATMRGVIQMLVDQGAKAGSTSSLSEGMEALTFQSPGSRIHVQSINNPEPLPHERVWVGDWPHPLPRDDTSLPELDLEKMNEGIQMIRSLTGAMTEEIEEKKRKSEEERLPQNYREWVRAMVEVRRFNRRPPEGWEARVAPQCRVFYVDHKTKSTTWVRPRE